MIMLWQAEVTVTLTEKSRSYPCFSIMGISMLPTEATSAVAEPETAPKKVEARILTWANPPIKRPTNRSATLTSLLVMLPAPMISPARIKKGIARKEKE